jgi:hypothetical protein
MGLNPETLPKAMKREMSLLGERYLSGLKNSSRTMRKSGLEIETFDYSAVKPTIDQIDRLLARHYGLTAEELDFIINYDIKYRMGAEESSDEE